MWGGGGQADGDEEDLIPGSSTVSSQEDSHMPLRKVWQEKRSSPVSQLHCTTSWDDVLPSPLSPPSKGTGRSKHLVARLSLHRGLGTFCVSTNQELLSRDAVEKLSDSRLRMANRNVRWPEKTFGSSICNRQTRGKPAFRSSWEIGTSFPEAP